MKNDAAVDAVDVNGRTPLSYAGHFGPFMRKAFADEEEKVVKLLLGRGAFIDSRDKRGCTPLSHAAMCGSAPTARVLLESGATVSSRDDEDNDILYLTIHELRQKLRALYVTGDIVHAIRSLASYAEMVTYLLDLRLQYDDDSYRLGRPGSRALREIEGYQNVVKLLIEYGVNPEVRSPPRFGKRKKYNPLFQSGGGANW